MAGKTNSTPFNRYSVIFSVPAGTPVLAARKGEVVQIKGNGRIDIFHDDSTIATYSQLGTVADGLFAGKAVTTGNVIGMAGADAAENPKEAFVQLTVWRPEPLPNASLKAISVSSGFEFVSFPLIFCITGPNDCRVLTQDQWVSKNKVTETRKQAKHKTR